MYANNPRQFTEDLLKHKKVRLIEDRMPYEDLAVLENFSADETTFALNRQNIKEKKDKNALKKVKILKGQLDDLKKFSLEGMKAIVDTVSLIDQNSQKILFKHFDQQSVNILAKQAPILMSNISKISSEAANCVIPRTINSDDYESDSSGNRSDHDEINKLEKIRKRIIAGENLEDIQGISSSMMSEKKSDTFEEMSDEGESSLEQEHLKKSKTTLSKDTRQKSQFCLKIKKSKSGHHAFKDSLENQLEVGNSIQ